MIKWTLTVSYLRVKTTDRILSEVRSTAELERKRRSLVARYSVKVSAKNLKRKLDDKMEREAHMKTMAPTTSGLYFTRSRVSPSKSLTIQTPLPETMEGESDSTNV